MDTCIAGLASRGFFPRCVYDVGAADGQWSRRAKHFWPNSAFVLFEPLPQRAADLDRLVAASTGISWHNFGLGRTSAKLDLSLSENLYESSFAYSSTGSCQARVESLDALLAEQKLPQPDFMKIDVQGFEFEVLAGAEVALRGVDVVILETYFHRFAPSMSLFHETVETMHQKGFRVYEVLDQMRRPHDNAVGQCDICFVRENHALLQCNAWWGLQAR